MSESNVEKAAEVTGWDRRLIAAAETLRLASGHSPRTVQHWQNMWNEWGEEGDRWIKKAKALDAAGLLLPDGATEERLFPRGLSGSKWRRLVTPWEEVTDG